VSDVHAGGECCAGQLIDSSGGRILLEASRAVDDGNYHGVRLRLCTVDQMSVQLWRRVDSTKYRLQWQTPLLTPTARHTSLSYVTVSHNKLICIVLQGRNFRGESTTLRSYVGTVFSGIGGFCALLSYVTGTFMKHPRRKK